MIVKKNVIGLLCMTCFLINGCNNKTSKDTGMYPQSLVKDESLINELSKISITNDRGYYEYNGEEYAKYSGKRYTDNNGNDVTSGEHFYKVEPIEWRFLENSDTGKFVVSEYILDANKYNKTYSNSYNVDENGNYPNNYEASQIREWLNNDFLHIAFKDDSVIASTIVNNSSLSRTHSTSSPTNDKVFLLSYAEVNDSTLFKSNIDRMTKATEYARARGANIVLNEEYLYNSFYWTRTAYESNPNLVYGVGFDGKITFDQVDVTSGGVRPALIFK